MIDRIGHVAVGNTVAFAPSRNAPAYTVTRITDRWIHCTSVTDPDKTRSLPVQSYRSLITVPWDDPRHPDNLP